MSVHIFILAGGKGCRLWPLSDNESPKQFLRFSQSISLFQQTLQRFVHKDDFIIHALTTKKYAKIIENEINEIGKELSIVQEPYANNTLSAVVNAVKTLKLNEDDYFLIVPTDHIFSEPEEIINHVRSSVEKKLTKQVITFGIKPDSPQTGYGYLCTRSNQLEKPFVVDQFLEKPNVQKAEKLISKEGTFWNTGIFLFHCKHFLDLLKIHQPMFYSFYQGKTEFETLPNISIDKGIMELSNQLSCFPLKQSWIDVGSWARIYEMLEKDENHNVIIGDAATLDTKRSLIISHTKPIATIGLDDVFVIESKQAILIGRKKDAEKVRHLVHEFNNICFSKDGENKKQTSE